MNDRNAHLANVAAGPSSEPASPGRDPHAKWFLALAGGWTAAIGLALWWNLVNIHETAGDLARVAARSSIEADLLYGRSAAMLGGAHGPDARTTSHGSLPPADTARGVATPSSRPPTSATPARPVRLTGLRPLRPGNTPDDWERKALEALQGGKTEVSAVERFGGEPHLRLMQPVRAAAACLACHAAQGYKEGAICGGISAAVPMKDYAAIIRAHQREEALAHGIIWSLGSVSLVLGGLQVQRRRRERDAAQMALHEGEERFRAIFEDSPVAIWEEDFSAVKERIDALRRSGVVDFRAHFDGNPDDVADLAGRVRVLEINEASASLFGAGTKEQVLRELPRYFTPESFAVFKDELVALAEGATRFRHEHVRFVVAGRPVVFDLTLSVAHGHEDTLSRVLVSFVDMTERRRAEEALRESEARLNKAQEIAHLGSWELDLAADRLTWSDEVYRIFGLPRDTSIASYEAFLATIHPDDRAAVDDAYSGSLRDGKDSYEIEHRIVRRSTGEVRHVREKCEHVRDASGKIVRSIGMVHDITEERLAENALRARNEELTRFNRAATDRELRMIELKREINEYCRKAGEPPRYPLDFSGPAAKR